MDMKLHFVVLLFLVLIISNGVSSKKRKGKGRGSGSGGRSGSRSGSKSGSGSSESVETFNPNPCDRVYCFNGGTCVVNEYDWSTQCKCRQGYTGRLCYRKASVSVSVTRTSCTCFGGQGNSCFFVPDRSSSWGDAQDYCGNFGAIIWEPDNQASSSVQTLLEKDTSYWTGVSTDYSCKAITWTTGYYSQWKLVDKSCTANFRFVCEKRSACGKQTNSIHQSVYNGY
ncbi:uncharacterized protein [Mytilus edulis]|uniref:uncharacterized protein n=1 Tax=Mytilus edulis TaxID=6550 RepID=UPI0039EF944B